MKIIMILALVLISLILGWMLYPRFADSEALVEKEIEIQMIDEIVLDSIPPTEENLPTGVFPVENRIVEQFSKDELVTVSHVEEPASDFAEAFIQIQFEGYDTCLPLSDGITYDVSEGESLNLEIVRCIWAPVDNLMYIGVYNLETETGYAYAYVDGNTQVSVPFADLPAGEYVVYIKNMGDRMITDGTLRYRVSQQMSTTQNTSDCAANSYTGCYQGMRDLSVYRKFGIFTVTTEDAKEYLYSFSTRRHVYKFQDIKVNLYI